MRMEINFTGIEATEKLCINSLKWEYWNEHNIDIHNAQYRKKKLVLKLKLQL